MIQDVVRDLCDGIVWSVSINNEDYRIYEPATGMFQDFVESKLLLHAQGSSLLESDEKVRGWITKSIRRLIHSFQKELMEHLRAKVYMEYADRWWAAPDSFSISVILGEVHTVHCTPIGQEVQGSGYQYNSLCVIGDMSLIGAIKRGLRNLIGR